MKELSLFLVFHETEASGGDQTVPGKTHKLHGNIALSGNIKNDESAEKFSRALYEMTMQMLAQKYSLKDIGSQIIFQTNQFLYDKNIVVLYLTLKHETISKKGEEPKVDYYYEWNNDQNYVEK